MKRTFLILVLICGLMLTGCARLTDLSDKQSDVIAEYMAGSVLRYTDNYMEALVYPDEGRDTSKAAGDTAENTATKDNTGSQPEAAKEEASVPAAAAGENTGKAEGTLSYQEFYQILSDGKYKIEYTGYKFYESYPQRDNYFTLEPTGGKKLLAVNFKAVNESKKAVKVDLGKIHIAYKLKTEEGRTYSPMVTLLDTDLNYINYTLQSGKADEAVLIFEVPENIKTVGLTLSISLNGQNAVIDLNE